MNTKNIRRKYDCPNKPYTEHPNHIHTSVVDGHETWAGEDEIETIITTRGEMRAWAFWAGFNEGALELPFGSLGDSLKLPLQCKPRGIDLRHIL